MKRNRFGVVITLVICAIVAWYLNDTPLVQGETPAAVETDLACHSYKEHRKVVDERLAIPILKDKKAPLYKVLRVIDGDTIVVEKDGQTRVRLMAMDAPELSTTRTGEVEYYGAEAARYATELIEASDWEVRLTYDQVKQDKYGRDLAYVWLKDGRMLNAVLVADGYGYSYTSSPKPEYVDLFLALMRDAREHNRGLWAVCS